MDISLGAPSPTPNHVFALVGGTLCSVLLTSHNSLASVVISAAVGAVVSYFTGFLLKRWFEKGK